MKKRLSIIVLALVLTMLLCMPAMAATVCKIGSKGYSSLQKAVSAVKEGQTIKVTKAIKTTDLVMTINAPGNSFTIDFAKKSYTYTGDDFAFGIAPGKSVTIKNMNINATKAFMLRDGQPGGAPPALPADRST